MPGLPSVHLHLDLGSPTGAQGMAPVLAQPGSLQFDHMPVRGNRAALPGADKARITCSWARQAHSRDCNLHCARVPLLPIWACACQTHSIPIWVLNLLRVPDVLVKALDATVQGVMPVVCRHTVDCPVQREAGALDPVCTAPHQHAKIWRGSVLQGQGQLLRCCRGIVIGTRAPLSCRAEPAAVLLQEIIVLQQSVHVLQGQGQLSRCLKQFCTFSTVGLICWEKAAVVLLQPFSALSEFLKALLPIGV